MNGPLVVLNIHAFIYFMLKIGQLSEIIMTPTELLIITAYAVLLLRLLMFEGGKCILLSAKYIFNCLAGDSGD